MTPEEERLMMRAVNKWGSSLQVLVAIEELAELTKELIKWLREQNIPRYKLVEELADVEIMVDQIKVMLSCRSEVAQMRGRKLKRVKEMLDEGIEPDPEDPSGT